jgi:anti-sigma regulatory factor (Ser/Thr protein kinase)
LKIGHERLDLLEVILANQRTEIPKAHQLLDELAVQVGLSPKVCTDLHVALEEHLTNVINYGYSPDQPGRIAVRLVSSPDALRVEIEDDARPFNPLLAPPVDVNQPLEDRPIGGLGIHMIRQLTDELHYELRSGHNVLTLIKRMPTP